MNKITFQFHFLRFSIKEQTLFAKRLSFLVKAGVPLIECLHLIRKQTKSKAKIRVYDGVIKDIANGQFLATSLGKYRKSLWRFYHQPYPRRRDERHFEPKPQLPCRRADKKACAQAQSDRGAYLPDLYYSIATLGVTGMLTVFIFPKIMPIFISLHVDLPLTTRILLWVSQYLQHVGHPHYCPFTL
jgi:type IV pilus assembly protein PilC